MPSRAEAAMEKPGPITERIADGICKRAFSSPEAVAYEMTIARALARVVAPPIAEHYHGGRILDVGCGGGRVATALSDAHVDGIVGIDPSRSQVQSFRRRLQSGTSAAAAQARAEALPFANDTFDYVFSSCAWKHWPEPAAGVAECARVTRPGGTVVIIEIDGSSSRASFEQFARTTAFPPGLRAAYVRFAMRTVVGVAPDAPTLLRSFAGLAVTPSEVQAIGASPFLVVTAAVH